VLKKLLERDDADRMPQSFLPRLLTSYAVRAFDVNAIDYLLKPFDRARVLQALDAPASVCRRRINWSRSHCRRTVLWLKSPVRCAS